MSELLSEEWAKEKDQHEETLRKRLGDIESRHEQLRSRVFMIERSPLNLLRNKVAGKLRSIAAYLEGQENE